MTAWTSLLEVELGGERLSHLVEGLDQATVVAELLLHLFALGDVTGVHDHAPQLGIVEQVAHQGLDPAPASIGVANPRWPPAAAARAGEHRGICPHGALPVVGVQLLERPLRSRPFCGS